MAKSTPSHEWIESVLNNPEFRAKYESAVTAADTYMASQLAQNLMQLRNQQRSNAYKKIFEARAKVADDLLSLQTSLSELIHYSAVAGEDTKIFVSLQHNVVTVTQKLSMFGEDDANGDGMRDNQAQAPGTPMPADPSQPQQPGAPVENAPSLDLDIDTAPMAPDNQPEPEANQVLPADKVQQDPDDVTDENAEVPGAKKPAPTPSPAHEGDNIDGPSELPDAPPAEEDAPGKDGAPADEGGFDTSEDEGGEDEGEAPADEKEAAPAEEPEGEAAPDAESDESAPDEEESSEDQNELHKEFGKVAKKAKAGGKKGLFESLTDEGGQAAAASVAEGKEGELQKPADNFRFVYRGVRGETISALITNKVYYFKPTPELCGGDVNTLNVAMCRFLENRPGYAAAMQKLNALRASGKLKVVKRVRLSKAQLRAMLHAPEQNKGQLGAVPMDEGTSWRYRGVGMQKISNQDVCLWLEVGDKEYGLVPNKKVWGDKSIEEVDGPLQGKLKKLSYTEGLKFMLGLVHTKKLSVIFQGKVSA